MTLADIRGQERVVPLLRGAATGGRVASSWLFLGPGGVGKRTAALAFAAALDCREAPGEGCGRCRSCLEIARGEHPDVRVWGVPEDKRILPIGVVRAVAESLALRPYYGPWKMAVVDDADAMNQEAANAFLLTLEEPPGDSVIILLAQNRSLIPETIQSRCRTVHFQPLPDALVEELLIADGADPKDASLAALMSEGSLAVAGEILRGGWAGSWKAAAELVAALPAEGDAAVMRGVPPKIPRDEAERFLVSTERIFRLAVRRRLGFTTASVDGVTEGAVAGLASRLGEAGLLASLESLLRARSLLKGNVNPRLTLEGCFLELADIVAGRGTIVPRRVKT